MATPRARRVPTRQHTYQYLIMCKPEQRVAWAQAANRNGLSLAAWIRKQLDESASASIVYSEVHISTK